MPSLRIELLKTILCAAFAATIAPAAQAQLQPGDLILIETAQPEANCPEPCWREIVVHTPPGGVETVIGTHLRPVPAQIAEGPDDVVWVAHTAYPGDSRVDALVDAAAVPVHEEQAIAAFTAYPGAQITGVTVAADGTMWIALKESPTSEQTTLYRRTPSSRVHAELGLATSIRSLQLSADQCTLRWLEGDRLVSYETCYKLAPVTERVFSEEKLNMRLLPDGGYLVTGSGPVERYSPEGELLDSIPVSGSTGRAEAVALTPDGSSYWIGTTDGILRRYNIEWNEPVETIYLLGSGVGNLSTYRGWTAALDGPVPPRELTIASAHGTSVELVWRDLARKESGYEVQTRIGSGPWVTNTVTDPGAYIQLTGLQQESDYQFRIRTLTRWGVSAWSNPVQARTGVVEAPRAPRRRGVPHPGF